MADFLHCARQDHPIGTSATQIGVTTREGIRTLASLDLDAAGLANPDGAMTARSGGIAFLGWFSSASACNRTARMTSR